MGSTFKRLKKILLYAYKNPHSKFYFNKYKKLDFKPSKIVSIDDFNKVPFLTRNDIVEADPLDRVFIPEKDIVSATMTSGTTGSGPMIIASGRRRQPFKGKNQYIYDAIFFTKLRKRGIRKILTIGSSQTSNRFIIAPPSDMFQVFVEVGNLTLAAEVVKKLKIEALFLSATTLYFLHPYLVEKNTLNNIKFIRISGEMCSDEKFKLLKRLYSKAEFTAGYAATEIGVIGYQCEFLEGKNAKDYHIADFIYPEIIDSNTLKNVEKGEVGELVLTTLDKKDFVAIRYRMGEEAKFLDKCSCGDKSPVVSILGRIGVDSISILGARFVRADLEKVFFSNDRILPDFKLHIYEKAVGLSITYEIVGHVVPKNKKYIGDSKFETKIATDIERKIRVSPTLNLSDLVRKGIFLPFKIKTVEELPQETKRRVFVVHA